MPIRVVVSDTSCLIDLRKGGLLGTALALPFQFVVPLPLVSAELHDFTPDDWAELQARGLQVIDLDPGQVQRAFDFKGQHPGLSAYDCFCLELTRSTEDAMLLTGDQQLRRRAAAIGVEVHGTLWVCDQIDEGGHIEVEDLAIALDRLLADPLVFLPADEMTVRIARLRGRARRR